MKELMSNFNQAIASDNIENASKILDSDDLFDKLTELEIVSSYNESTNPSQWEFLLSLLEYYCLQKTSKAMEKLSVLCQEKILTGNHYDALKEKYHGFIPMTFEARSMLLLEMVEEEHLPSESCLAECMRIRSRNVVNLQQFIEDDAKQAWGNENERNLSFLDGALKQAGYTGLDDFGIDQPVSSTCFSS